jgi:hypothetical protein
MDLPSANDWNMSADANYCGGANTFDYYATCKGAKIWLVPTNNYDAGAKTLTVWNPSTYLFETDLINYNDTNN